MKTNLVNLISCADSFSKGEIDEQTLKKAAADYLSDDKDIIPNMLLVLEAERNRNKELLVDSNMELSRALIGFNTFNGNSTEDIEQRKFISERIMAHYIKWKEYVSCVFNIIGLS